jgi:hypothetical protein
MAGRVAKNELGNVWKNAAMAKSSELLRDTEENHEKCQPIHVGFVPITV